MTSILSAPLATKCSHSYLAVLHNRFSRIARLYRMADIQEIPMNAIRLSCIVLSANGVSVGKEALCESGLLSTEAEALDIHLLALSADDRVSPADKESFLLSSALNRGTLSQQLESYGELFTHYRRYGRSKEAESALLEALMSACADRSELVLMVLRDFKEYYRHHPATQVEAAITAISEFLHDIARDRRLFWMIYEGCAHICYYTGYHRYLKKLIHKPAAELSRSEFVEWENVMKEVSFQLNRENRAEPAYLAISAAMVQSFQLSLAFADLLPLLKRSVAALGSIYSAQKDAKKPLVAMAQYIAQRSVQSVQEVINLIIEQPSQQYNLYAFRRVLSPALSIIENKQKGMHYLEIARNVCNFHPTLVATAGRLLKLAILHEEKLDLNSRSELMNLAKAKGKWYDQAERLNVLMQIYRTKPGVAPALIRTWEIRAFYRAT